MIKQPSKSSDASVSTRQPQNVRSKPFSAVFITIQCSLHDSSENQAFFLGRLFYFLLRSTLSSKQLNRHEKTPQNFFFILFQQVGQLGTFPTAHHAFMKYAYSNSLACVFDAEKKLLTSVTVCAANSPILPYRAPYASPYAET